MPLRAPLPTCKAWLLHPPPFEDPALELAYQTHKRLDLPRVCRKLSIVYTCLLAACFIFFAAVDPPGMWAYAESLVYRVAIFVLYLLHMAVSVWMTLTRLPPPPADDGAPPAQLGFAHRHSDALFIFLGGALALFAALDNDTIRTALGSSFDLEHARLRAAWLRALADDPLAAPPLKSPMMGGELGGEAGAAVPPQFEGACLDAWPDFRACEADAPSAEAVHWRECYYFVVDATGLIAHRTLVEAARHSGFDEQAAAACWAEITNFGMAAFGFAPAMAQQRAHGGMLYR